MWFPLSFLRSDSDSPAIFHVFCDASAVAYCSVVYALQGGESRIVMARSSLAPVSDQLSIPLLKLMAALTGDRLMEFVRQSLNLSLPTVYFWTDSRDVLFWMTSVKPRRVFVEKSFSYSASVPDRVVALHPREMESRRLRHHGDVPIFTD